MGKFLEVDILVEHMGKDVTMVVLKKNSIVTTGLIEYIVDALNDMDVADKVRVGAMGKSDYDANVHNMLVYGQKIKDDALVGIIKDAIVEYMDDDVKEVNPQTNFTGDWPAGIKLSDAAAEIIKNFSKTKVNKDSKLAKPKTAFTLKGDAPEYISGVNMCPNVGLMVCGEIFMDVYRDYLLSTAITNSGDESPEAPAKFRATMDELFTMMGEFHKHERDCEQCEYTGNCEFGE